MSRRATHRASWIGAAFVAVTTIAAAWGGRVNPQVTTWPALLNMAYPLLAMVSAVLAVAWLLCRRWRLTALLVAALLLTWPALRVNAPLRLAAHDVHASAQRFLEFDFRIVVMIDHAAFWMVDFEEFAPAACIGFAI